MAEHRHVSLLFADGERREFSAGVGQSILDAGIGAGLPLIHQCRSGSCGTCVATLEDGLTSACSGAGSTLLPGEYARGVRLLCQSEATANCTFSLNYELAVTATSPQRAHAFVDAIDTLAPDVVRLTLELAENNWLDFRPGQYLRLKVPGTDLWRSYSPASVAQALPRIELLVRLIDGGVMSGWLSRTGKIDEVVELEGPFGQFFLRETRRAPLVFLAGGTGLAPVLAMLESIRRKGGTKPPLLVCFGCRTEASLFGLEELTLFEHWLPSLSLRIAVEQSPVPGRFAGTPLSALTAADFAHTDTVTYVCGPPAMVEATQTLLGTWGVSASRIHCEQFSPSASLSEVC